MPALDHFHNVVRNALVKDGWTITHDPFRLTAGQRNMFVDLGAERMLAAAKGTKKIAVEVKTFMGRSDIADLEQAIGQYVLYHLLLQRSEPGRTLYIAVPIDVLNTLFQEVVGLAVREAALTHLIAFDPETEEILEWLPEATS